jgi:triosephosphate isomerase
MARTLIVGNWKMHLNASQASLLLHRLHERIRISRDVEVVLAPSMLVLQPLSVQIDRRKFRLAAQNAYYKDEGACTGEVSFTMLRDLVHYAIIGHSERRHVFNESNQDIGFKVAAAFRNGIIPILCVGETKSQRDGYETKRVLHDQLAAGLHQVTAADMKRIVIAYEPVWALSSGTDYGHHEIASPDQVKKAVDTIRCYVNDLFGKRAANAMRILYGGSVSADTAAGFLNVEGTDGLLVGGASLNYLQFSGVVEAAERHTRAGQ